MRVTSSHIRPTLLIDQGSYHDLSSHLPSHSPRLCAFLGSLVLGLSLLFTSFASRLHQIVISQVIILGFGVSILQSSHNVMLGETADSIVLQCKCNVIMIFQVSISRRTDSISR